MFRQDLVAGFVEALHRKDIGSGEAATKRNDLRLLRDFEKLTDGGTLDAQGALRVPRLPKRRHSILLDTRPDLNVRCETMATCFRVFQFQVSGFKARPAMNMPCGYTLSKSAMQPKFETRNLKLPFSPHPPVPAQAPRGLADACRYRFPAHLQPR